MKYQGSKQRIAKDIVPIIQKYIDDSNVKYYLEPFCGSCSIIEKIKCDRKFAYDLNKYLIYLLIHVKQGYKLYESVSKELYDRARNAYHNGNKDREFADWEIGCIGFLASFNGRFFDGGYAKPGYEKTKKGERYRDYYQEAKANLLAQCQSKGFQDIMFGIADYKTLILDFATKYVIYCDPPYRYKKQYDISKNFNHEEFWDVMRMWSQKHIVLISELEAPDDFECIWEKSVSRSIKPTDKERTIEKLFKYKGDEL